MSSVALALDICEENLAEVYQKVAEGFSNEYVNDVTSAMAVENDDAQNSADLMLSHNKTFFSACGLCLNQDKCSIMINIQDQGNHHK